MADITLEPTAPSKLNPSYVLCGLMSGVLTKTVCAPFDRIRLLYQIQPMFGRVDAETAGVIKYEGVYNTARRILREEGVVGLWRGNMTNTIRGGLVYATKFGINDSCRERLKNNFLLQSWFDLRNKRAADPSRTRFQNDIILSMMAGSTAGVTQKVLTYPLDLVSVRMALGINTRELSRSCTYNGIYDCLRKIATTEGIRGFYKGFFPTLCTGAPYVALQMTLFEFYKQHILSVYNYKEKELTFKQVAAVSSVAGSAAGVTALCIIFPGDTVRKRMMNNAISNEAKLYKNARHCIRSILVHEGIVALYYGVLPSIIKCFPSGAIQFLSYEMLKHLVNNF